MSNAKRKMIQGNFYVDHYDLSGSATKIIQVLQEWVNQYGDSVHIDIDINRGWYDDCEIEITGTYQRQETDEEFNKRIARQKKARETAKKKRAEEKVKKEDEERKELARLLKKYGEEA